MSAWCISNYTIFSRSIAIYMWVVQIKWHMAYVSKWVYAKTLWDPKSNKRKHMHIKTLDQQLHSALTEIWMLPNHFQSMKSLINWESFHLIASFSLVPSTWGGSSLTEGWWLRLCWGNVFKTVLKNHF